MSCRCGGSVVDGVCVECGQDAAGTPGYSIENVHSVQGLIAAAEAEMRVEKQLGENPNPLSNEEFEEAFAVDDMLDEEFTEDDALDDDYDEDVVGELFALEEDEDYLFGDEGEDEDADDVGLFT